MCGANKKPKTTFYHAPSIGPNPIHLDRQFENRSRNFYKSRLKSVKRKKFVDENWPLKNHCSRFSNGTKTGDFKENEAHTIVFEFIL